MTPIHGGDLMSRAGELSSSSTRYLQELARSAALAVIARRNSEQVLRHRHSLAGASWARPLNDQPSPLGARMLW